MLNLNLTFAFCFNVLLLSYTFLVARLVQSHFRLNFSHILFGPLIRLIAFSLVPFQMQILDMHVLIAERSKCTMIGSVPC